jgi:hypothetical protein
MDGKYLFFRVDISGSIRPYWVEAGFIDDLREAALNER